LALAVLLLEQANFLILDEPTNHLDIMARESLEEMLSEFDGTILFVSHDRYFMDRIATKLWIVEDGGVSFSLGNYTDYQRQLGRRAAQIAQSQKGAQKPEPNKVEAEPNGSGAGLVDVTAKGKPKRRTETDVQKKLAKVERSIAQLEGRLNEINDAIAVATADQDLDAIAALGAEYEKVQTELDDVYGDWEGLSAQVEEFALAND
jgi:ATP-binding cassette subfamily F protein 3